MFTGIIEETGSITDIKRTTAGVRLEIQTGSTGQDLSLGDSLAVNGCCLTATKLSGPKKARLVRMDLLDETWQKTNLQHLKAGSKVNLERPLRADGRFDGHMVTGHVEGLGKIKRWEQVGNDWCLEVASPSSIMKYVVEKGSIAIDGISLTVAKVFTRHFRIWIIPHTYQVTRLHEARQGDFINVETDILGKYVARLLQKTGKR